METNREIEIQELLGKLDAGAALTVLDVRNDDEYEHWKIESRSEFNITHIPYFDFIEDEQAALERLPKSAAELVVVCAKGGSSELVAQILREAGIPARNLIGGMMAYGEYLSPARVTTADRLDLWQLNRRGKGCLSYVLLSRGEAVVVDPSRAIDTYDSFLGRAGARLSYVLDTHIHADHISGAPALAARLGAPYFVSAGAGFDLRQSATSLKDGDELRFGEAVIRVLATPGHTPGSVCYLVSNRYLLSGDTLFRKSVGRPDLGGHIVEWSQDLFRTLRERIAALDDSILVLPAHYADLSEIGANGVVSARLGELRRDLAELQISDVASFTAAMEHAVRTPPPEYAQIIETNLGTLKPDNERMIEWELGKNQCAAGADLDPR